MKETSPGYYAIIPADVRYDTGLTGIEKLLYGEISALTNKDGYCWATNSYFAKLYSVTNRTISKSISRLEEYGYISISDSDKKQGVRYIHLGRKLLGGWKKTSRGVEENFYPPLEENFYHNNTSINIKNNIYTPSVKRTHHQGKPWRFYFDEILKSFEEILGEFTHISVPRKLTDARKKAIKTRILDDMPDIEDWQEYFYYISQSKFLATDCTASGFDWFLRPSIMQKIKEGRYHSPEEGKYRPYEIEQQENKDAPM